MLCKNLSGHTCDLAADFFFSAKELEDSEELPLEVTGLTVLLHEPPPITTEEFLESLAFCVHDWNGTLVSKWHRFDSYSSFPVTKDEIFK